MRRSQRLLVLAAVTGVLAAASAGSAGQGRPARTRALDDALARRAGAEAFGGKARGDRPADRYEPAGGCYVLTAVGLPAGVSGDVTRSGAAYVAKGTGTPLRFQAFDLGKYLLFGDTGDFLAVEGGPADDAQARPASREVTGYVKGTGDENLNAVRQPVVDGANGAAAGVDAATAPVRAQLGSSKIVSAAAPSANAEWVLEQVSKTEFALRLPVDDGEPENPGPLNPPIAGTLAAANDGTLSVRPGKADGAGTRFTLRLVDGCREYPEITTNVSGDPYRADTAYEESQGYVDAHLHMMAFEFIGGRSRCGRPWHPYGVAYALVDCPDHEPGGHGAVLEAALSGGNPVEGHDTAGWPEFSYWPKYNSLTHEQVYYKWLERSWRGGLRMFTNLLVDNNVLCELYPYKKNSCNEMDGVLLQAQRLHELQRYVDAQSGGPGEGWFRIVRDPFEARRVINEGRLAVVMGVEVSVPFDCGEHLETPHCTKQQIADWVSRLYELGVRQMELTNKFDNALTGVTGDDGVQSVVNAGNAYETGHFWKMETCDEDDGRHDKLQPNASDGFEDTKPPADPGRDAIFSAVLETFGETGAAPVYAHGPHCNTIGLTDLGRAALDQLMSYGMIFDPDHMSAKAREQAMAHVGNYSGLVSSHSWADDPTYDAILAKGGVVTPHAGGPVSFVAKWRKLRAMGADDRWEFGIGFGSDVNGFSTQGAPRNMPASQAVQYPFTALGGVRVDKQVSGVKSYDYNKTGTDHYGLYPDWVEDVRLAAGEDGERIVADLTRGVEMYLQMWERAIGIAPEHCLDDSEVAKLKKKMAVPEVLANAGQPRERIDETFVYCHEDGTTVTVTFDRKGVLKSVS